MVIWSGKYDISIFDKYNFNLTEWKDRQVDFINKVKNDKLVRDDVYKNNTLLANVLLDNFPNGATVLEYGGCLGAAYFSLKEITNLNYNIIETPVICSEGRKKITDINFYTSILDFKYKPDIAYIRTSLQYAKNYKQTLLELIETNPKYLILSKTSCYDGPTFLTLQNLREKYIPYWFINFDELNNIIINNGFKLLEKNNHDYLNKRMFDKDIPHVKNTIDLLYMGK